MALNRCENVAPSLAKVYEMKTRMGNAKNAAKLLKRKARVFDLILRDHSRDLINNTQLMMNIMREAFIVLAAARYSTGDFYAVVEECVDVSFNIIIKIFSVVAMSYITKPITSPVRNIIYFPIINYTYYYSIAYYNKTSR